MNDPINFFGMATTSLELVAIALSVITVILNIRRVHWAWLFSILSSATYGVLFFGSRLYGTMALQGVFIIVSLWGWYQWLYGGDKHDELPVTRSSQRAVFLSVVAWGMGFLVIAWFLQNYTNSEVPVQEGFLTAGSLVGQLLLSRKKLENWIVWIIVDVLYVGLWVYQGLHATAVLYSFFVVLAAIGLATWYRDSRETP